MNTSQQPTVLPLSIDLINLYITIKNRPQPIMCDDNDFEDDQDEDVRCIRAKRTVRAKRAMFDSDL